MAGGWLRQQSTNRRRSPVEAAGANETACEKFVVAQTTHVCTLLLLLLIPSIAFGADQAGVDGNLAAELEAEMAAERDSDLKFQTAIVELYREVESFQARRASFSG